MGSLAHYMQELSHDGINIRDFVHEGTLPYWQEAIEAPQGRVGWILIEERAEGGDVLAARARAVVRVSDRLHARVRGRRGRAVQS